jgi:glycosyltransferase involved in cell wall biosynthesis
MKRNFKKYPLISIGLPTFNRKLFLQKTVSMLLNQTYSNLELIISDNASIDGTDKLCKRLAQKDKRIRFFRQKSNVGMYKNFNFVLQKARGKYFLWTTDDDVWKPDYISELYRLIESYQKASVAVSNYTLFSEFKKDKPVFSEKEYLPIEKSVLTYMDKSVLVTYGLAKTKMLKNTGGFYSYPSIIPDGIGDAIGTYRLILSGGVCFSKKALWKKRDSGLSFDKYKYVYEHTLTTTVKTKIKRYLYFPLVFLIDLCIMVKDTGHSNQSVVTKINLVLFCFGFYFRKNFVYLKTLLTGVAVYIKGYF